MSPPVSPACADWEPLLVERAAGTLDAADEGRVAAHVADCAACRDEAAQLDQVLSLAALPLASEAERRAVAAASGEALARWKRSRRRWKAASAFAAALAVAAAAVFVAASPGLVRKAPSAEPAAVAWELPDLDAIWETAAVAGLEGDAAGPGGAADASAMSDADHADALYAELDELEIDSQ